MRRGATAGTYRTRGRRIGAPLLLAPLLALGLAPASAAESPWSLCEHAAINIEASHKMPRALLVSVSLAESGRFNPATGATRAWPWTINAEGQSFYFASKREAVGATRRLLDSGVRSIDVGCMQVNLRYHPDAFPTLEDAFDPLSNVSYGADFLKRLKSRAGSWPEAIELYHSQSPALRERYFARVIRIWTGERTRVASLVHSLRAQADMTLGALAQNQPPRPAAAIGLRPAPMVLDGAPGAGPGLPAPDVRETAAATVGLRLSLADEPAAAGTGPVRQPPPRVLEPATDVKIGIAAPTVLADAAPGA